MEHILKYSKPASRFVEALPLGCGTLGAMIYGGVEKEKISLNLDTLWSGVPNEQLREGAYEAYSKAKALALEGKLTEAQNAIEEGFCAPFSEAYMPMGNLYIEAKTHDFTAYRRTLSLKDALVRVEYDTARGHASREYFVSHPAHALIMRFETDFAEDYILSADSQLRHEVCASGETLRVSGYAPRHVHARGHVPAGEEQIIWGEGTTGFTYAVRVITDGKVTVKNNTLVLCDARTLSLLLVANTSFISYKVAPIREHIEKTLSALDALSREDYRTHKSAHMRDYSSLYDTVSLDLNAPADPRDTDERLLRKDSTNGLYELLFNFGRYLTIASSREDSEATNLQGIWNEELVPPWQSNYTVNINTEMNYWPTLMCNLIPCHTPLIRLIEKISDTGRAVAQNYYHARGFVAHHNVDLWGKASPVGIDTKGCAVYAFWNMSSGWLCHHLYEHFLYTQDLAFLRETAYPIMCESARFYLDILAENKNSHLILTPTTSAENTFRYNGRDQAVSRYSTMSQSILQNLLADIQKSAELLGISDAFTKEVEEVLPRLHPFAIGSMGQMLEWDSEYEESDIHHRHVSHLYGLYPGTLLTTDETPEYAEACRKSLCIRGDNGTGWSLGWKFNLWAKLKDGEHALRLVDTQLRLVTATETNMSTGGGTYPNMFDAHPPFQIDGNFGVTAGIAQMLLQCECGQIKLLPALPSAFRCGEVKGLLAHGGVTVNIAWREGKLTSYTLSAPHDITLTVSYGEDKKTHFIKAGEHLTSNF